MKQVCSRRESHRIESTVQWLLGALLIASLIAFVRTLAAGSWSATFLEFSVLSIDVSLGLLFDSLSGLLFLMVASLGVFIASFSKRFMAGDHQKQYFFRYLAQTVFSVSFFVLSSNLLMLLVAWLAVEHNLHRLLLMYGQRRAALQAARKRFFVGSLGNLCLLGAVISTYFMFGTFEFTEIFRAIGESSLVGSELTTPVTFVGFLVVAAAMLQSVQFPFHFWLPETMETSTPVSALMHAGIINAGGFLVIRMSPLLQHAPHALMFLALVGAISAVFGSLVMITQTDIKKKLAYSTISQMGLMFVGCGLGLFSMALYHILAHSFYKSTAFLSTGTLVSESKKAGYGIEQPSRWRFAAVIGLGFLVIVFGNYFQEGAYLGYFTYGAVLVLGLSQNICRIPGVNYDYPSVARKIAAAVVLAIVAYIFIEHALSQQIQGIVGSSVDFQGPLFVLTNLAIYGLFALGFWASARLMNPNRGLVRKLYIYLWNGAYLSHVTTYWMSRLFPSQSKGKLNVL